MNSLMTTPLLDTSIVVTPEPAGKRNAPHARSVESRNEAASPHGCRRPAASLRWAHDLYTKHHPAAGPDRGWRRGRARDADGSARARRPARRDDAPQPGRRVRLSAA